MLSGLAFTLKHSGLGQVLLKGKPWVNTSTAAEAQAAAPRSVMSQGTTVTPETPT